MQAAARRASARAVFLDKDGTLIDDVPHNADPGKIRLSEGAGDALQAIQATGFLLIVVSNQPGIARGLIPEPAMAGVRQRIDELLSPHGVQLDDFHYCPHWPHGRLSRHAFACDCRKPRPGMLVAAAALQGIDLARSWMIGDILDDIEAGRNAGCRTLLIDNGNETEWLLGPKRRPHRLARDLRHAARIVSELSGRAGA